MSTNGNYGATQLFAAFLGGAAAGAIVGLLTAPRAGKESREKIKEYVTDRTDEAAHIPQAVKAASGAARNAFVKAMNTPA